MVGTSEVGGASACPYLPPRTGPLLRSGSMARSRTSSDVELLVELDRDERRAAPPAARARAPRARSATGGSRRATVLPSTRALADQLGVSRGMVVEAYEQLVAEGYLEPPGRRDPGRRAARRAAGRRAGPRDPPSLAVRLPARPARRRPSSRARPGCGRCAACSPRRRATGSRTSAGAARRSCGSRWRPTSTASAGRPPTRPTSSSATGFAQGLGLTGAGARARGARGGSRSRIRRTPSTARSIADGRARGRRRSRSTTTGIHVDRLDAADVGRRPRDRRPPVPDRRRAAAGAPRGARRLGRPPGGLVIEDDYDAEFRYDREPIGALQGLARTASSTPGRRARRSRRGCGSAGSSRRRALVDGLDATRSSAADHGLAGPRPARVRRLPRPRRARPPPAPDAADLPRAAATPCSRRWPATCPSCGRSAPRPACTSSPGCRPASTRRRSSRRPTRRGSGCPGSSRAGSPAPAPRDSCSATGGSAKSRSRRASRAWRR